MLARKLEDSTEGEKGLADTNRIQRYAERMNRLIGDLVDVASIDAGRLSVTPARGDAVYYRSSERTEDELWFACAKAAMPLCVRML